jgi:hypothetical protein
MNKICVLMIFMAKARLKLANASLIVSQQVFVKKR